MAHDISFSTFVFAPPDEVMELLTNPVFIQEWSGKKGWIEKQPGGKFEMFDGWVKGEVLKAGEKELSFSWKPAEWKDDVEASVVTMRLEATGRGTEVFLDHTGFPSAEEAAAHLDGWKEYYFNPIEEYLANRKFG